LRDNWRCPIKETVVSNPFLLVERILQNQDGVVSIKVDAAEALSLKAAHTESHDFH